MATQIVSQSVCSPVTPAVDVPRTRSSVYEIITNQILAALEQGEIPWRKPWRVLPPANLITKKPYRGINVFLLGFAGYGSQYWLTFNQARQLGGNIRRGERTVWPFLLPATRRCRRWRSDDRQTAPGSPRLQDRGR